MAQSLQLAPCPHVTMETKCFPIEAEGDIFDIPDLAKDSVRGADKRNVKQGFDRVDASLQAGNTAVETRGDGTSLGSPPLGS